MRLQRSTLPQLLLVLCLILAGLQPASATHTPALQAANTLTNSAQHQHTAPSSNTDICVGDCLSTTQHCCVYALCNTPALITFKHNVTHHILLSYFFNSRAITPITPPPKWA